MIVKMLQILGCVRRCGFYSQGVQAPDLQADLQGVSSVLRFMDMNLTALIHFTLIDHHGHQCLIDDLPGFMSGCDVHINTLDECCRVTA